MAARQHRGSLPSSIKHVEDPAPPVNLCSVSVSERILTQSTCPLSQETGGDGLAGVSVRRNPPVRPRWMRRDLPRSAHVWVSVPGDNLIPFRLGESWRIPPLGARARRGVLCNEFRSFQHKGSLQERLLQKILGSLPYHPSETSVVDQ